MFSFYRYTIRYRPSRYVYSLHFIFFNIGKTQNVMLPLAVCVCMYVYVFLCLNTEE